MCLYTHALCLVLVLQFHLILSKKEFNKDIEDGKSSLVFVFDTTGSMYNDLKQLREGAELILDTAHKNENNLIYNLVFVPFSDPGVGPATVTRDKEVLKAALNAVRVSGGGNCPEMSLGGIQLALNVSLSHSYIYVFTDATANDHGLVHKVLDLVQRKQSQVVFVLTGHCKDLDKPSYKVYQQISAASSGQIFNLNKTSVHKVLDFVRSSLTGRTVNLGSVVNRAGQEYQQTIPVDNTLGEVTVSITGSNTKLKVANPSGEQMKGPPKLIKTLDLSEIMVVKVLQPEPGNWTISVGSDVDYSVKVVGLSNLTFQHGFSVERPNTMFETSYRPLKGANNYMMITLSKTKANVTLTSAEILGLDGENLFEMPLEFIDRTNQVYLANAFLPPDGFFFIAINGFDENRHELRRIGATAIEAKLPDAPFLTVPTEVSISAHESVVLRCNIESLVPVTGQWYRERKRLQNPVSSLQTSYVDYTIDKMSKEKIGQYRCIAKNVAGVSVAYTNVTLLVDPPRVNLVISDMSPTIGDNVTITCEVTSDTELLKLELHFNGDGYQDEMDVTPAFDVNGYYVYSKSIIVSEHHNGSYTCYAANEGGENNKTSRISVRKKPTVYFLYKTLRTKLDRKVTIKCHSLNADRVKIIAPNGTTVIYSDNGIVNDVSFDIDKTSWTDAGVWTCVGERKDYFDTDTMTFSVNIDPKVTIEGSKSLTLSYGTNYTLYCHITAVPEPTIVWYKDSVIVQDTHVTKESDIDYLSYLNLENITENMESIYHCSAINTEGFGRNSVKVDVKKSITVLEAPKNASVQIYGSFKLICKADSYPESQILWYYNNTILVAGNTVSIDNTSVTISCMDFGHTGLYSCKAGNKYETVYLNATLTLQGLENPEIAKMPTNKFALIGAAANITCRILRGKPIPKIKWVHDNNFETNTSPKNVIVTKNSSILIIPRVNKSHNGIYKCIATNIIGQDIYSLQFTVQFPPQLNESEVEIKNNVTQEAGAKVELSCGVTAVPSPFIVWLKNTEPIAYSKNIYLSDSNVLVIEQSSQNDNGVYTCTASNTFGSVQRNFTLMLYVLPKIMQPNIGPNIEVLEGQLVELPCFVEGYPRPFVQWKQNGNVFEERTRKLIDDNFTLRFIANLTDFGEYTCEAKNDYGNLSQTYMVYIWVPPSMKQPLTSSKQATVHTNVSLQCDAVGFPVPTVSWEFRGDALTENTTNVSFNDIGNLFITNVHTEHGGVYACISENVAGIAKKYINLIVNGPPQIVPDNYTGPYIATNRDMSISVPCNATGKPTPYIRWTMNNQYIDTDSRYSIDLVGTLHIPQPTSDLSGNYTCIAENMVGIDNKTVAVLVYDIPETMQADESMATVTFLENSSNKLLCPIKISHADSLKWYKNGEILKIGSLIFEKVAQHDSGTYVCVVTNAIASISASVDVTVQWPPQFITDDGFSQSMEVIKGDDAYFDCNFDAKPKAEIRWSFNSERSLSHYGAQFRILNVQPHHSGIYKCLVANKHGTISRKYTLTVLEPPFISDFDFFDVELKVGSNATLTCDAKGTPLPERQWTYNNTNWNELNKTLVSLNVSQKSEGLFRCDAKNLAGSVHVVYRVKVLIPASVSSMVMYINNSAYDVNDKIETKINDTIRISCGSDGNPLPHVQWLQNGQALSENDQEIYYADLLFENVHTKNAGVYICSVTNSVGFQEKKITVDILEPPKIYKTIFDVATLNEKLTELEIIVDQTFYLHCHPYGNPVPQIYWFKDEVPLRLFDSKMYSTEYGEILVSNRALIEQSGNYTCVARNKIGEEAISYLVNILAPPPNSKENGTKLFGRVGKNISIDCDVQGTPRPQVTWLKLPYTYLTDEANPRIKFDNDNYTLIINNLELKDRGNYSCILTNKVGTAELFYEVAVEQTPTILTNNATDNIENTFSLMQRSVVLKCPVEGQPVPKITWLKDTLKISTNLSNYQRALDDSLLIIWKALARDAGQYICVAENKIGTDHRRFNVHVKVPGKWGNWSMWSFCNVTCGLGYQHRKRSCQYIEDEVVIDKLTNNNYIILDESTCKGSENDRRKCHMPPCEEWASPSGWSRWSPWSACTAPCGAASQARSRRCRAGRGRCHGDNVQIRKCSNLPPCPGQDQDLYNQIEDNDPYEPEATGTEPDDINTEIEEFEFVEDLGSNYTMSESLQSSYFVSPSVSANASRDCNPGFTMNTDKNVCQDIDECLLDGNACHSSQSCRNSAGGYSCVCPRGYSALGPAQRCLDVNECSLRRHGCQFACVNTAGGFVCACPPPLRLFADRRRCRLPRATYNNHHSYEELETDSDILVPEITPTSKLTNITSL